MHRQSSILLSTFLTLLLAVLSSVPSAAAKSTGKEDVPPTGLSHVRVVRLSFVEGTVTVRRPGSDEWARATVNTPIEEGFSLATGKSSFAEVQFENGSTVRLGELSNVGFTELALSAQGGHINHLKLQEGYATCRVVPGHHDDFQLTASNVNLTPQGKAEFRTDLDQESLRTEVFSGEVLAADQEQTEKLAKNHTLMLALASGTNFEVSNSVAQDSWDKWSRARDQQSTLANNDSAFDLGGPFYGWDDLDVYGSWGFFPGFGYGWAPYEPVGWSPYAAGMWSWYPTWGYTWISGEPWGWLPFHYGFWNFSSSMGWFWTPGSFAVWNPALVNWYSGPGWIGWAPIGAAGTGGAAPCMLATANCLTAVPRGVLGSGRPIVAGGPYLLHPGANEAIIPIAPPDVAPEHSAMLSGQLLTAGPAANAVATSFTRGTEGAPSTVVMGRQVSADAFLGPHASFSSSKGPAYVRFGDAMGGKPPLSSAAPGARPVASGRGTSGSAAAVSVPQPQILSRASIANASLGAGGFGGRGQGGFGGGGARGGAAISGGGATHSAGASVASGGGHR